MKSPMNKWNKIIPIIKWNIRIPINKWNITSPIIKWIEEWLLKKKIPVSMTAPEFAVKNSSNQCAVGLFPSRLHYIL